MAANVQRRVTPVRRRLRRFELVELWVSRMIIWVIIVAVLFPAWSIVVASLQKGGIFTNSLVPDPNLFTLDNYKWLLTSPQSRYPIWIRNTVLMGAAVGFIQVSVTVTSSYAFSRLRFWGRKNGIRFLLLMQMMPSFVSLTAIQYVLFKLDMANLFGFMLVMTGASAWNIWLIKGFMDGLPRDMDEAAKVDGCTDWQVFYKIILPLSRPMLAVMFLFTFMGIFGEFIMSSVLLRAPGDYLLSQGLRTFSTNAFSTNWGRLAAAVVLTSAPIGIVWGFMQKYVESGLTRGAVKG